MANRLKMAEVQAIQALLLRGWSRRRIARELGIDRETVARYTRLAGDGASGLENQPNPPAGSDVQTRPNPPPGSSGPPSACEPFREIILAALEQGLSAQRIWQELRSDHGFTVTTPTTAVQICSDATNPVLRGNHPKPRRGKPGNVESCDRERNSWRHDAEGVSMGHRRRTAESAGLGRGDMSCRGKP